MPGIEVTGIHHVSRSVGDMDRSLGFYRDLLGLEVVLDTEMQGEMLDREVGLEGAHLRLVELGAGDGGTLFELLQYFSPHPAAKDARPCDVGADHVAVLVTDIEAAHRELEAVGVRFTCPPQEVDAGYFRGHHTAYCFDPDGLIVELWQTP
jgi:catechol 2,3-dioxygenase-like lactoylglutathione lyase family enzyme